MVRIEHIQQVNDGRNWKCGEACLKMILDYYGTEYIENDIWDNIKATVPYELGQYYAHTHKMIKYSMDHGLNATGYKAQKETCLEVLKQINDKNIPAILKIIEKKSKKSHFVVYTGIKNKMYYYVNPNSNRQFDYFKEVEIEDVWASRPKYDIDGYFFVVFDREESEEIHCRECGKSIPVVHSSLQPLLEGIACPYCGKAAYICEL